MATLIRVGDRFTETDMRPYTEGGERRTHVYTLVYEVVSTDEVGFKYRTVEVVAEEGRPAFGGTPVGGSMAWFGLDAALTQGRITIDRR